jgi:hypothetical protein
LVELAVVILGEVPDPPPGGVLDTPEGETGLDEPVHGIPPSGDVGGPVSPLVLGTGRAVMSECPGEVADFARGHASVAGGLDRGHDFLGEIHGFCFSFLYFSYITRDWGLHRVFLFFLICFFGVSSLPPCLSYIITSQTLHFENQTKSKKNFANQSAIATRKWYN